MTRSDINIIEEPNHHEPEDVLLRACDSHDRIALSFSGAEDVVLIDMASRLSLDVRVFCLDTGRLHDITYTYIDTVRKHYDISIDILFPDAKELEKMVNRKGLLSFYEEGHTECCTVRKINPLKRHLSGFDAWITGQRRDQSPTRAFVPQKQSDDVFSTHVNQLTKYNPLANWRSEDVWHYIRRYEIPYNPLHDQGYRSIGCAPCTRPTGPGQHEREGRWWWEQSEKKECGLHAVNVS